MFGRARLLKSVRPKYANIGKRTCTYMARDTGIDSNCSKSADEGKGRRISHLASRLSQHHVGSSEAADQVLSTDCEREVSKRLSPDISRSWCAGGQEWQLENCGWRDARPWASRRIWRSRSRSAEPCFLHIHQSRSQSKPHSSVIRESAKGPDKTSLATVLQAVGLPRPPHYVAWDWPLSRAETRLRVDTLDCKMLGRL
jgi:hypothetical protein